MLRCEFHRKTGLSFFPFGLLCLAGKVGKKRNQERGKEREKMMTVTITIKDITINK